MKLTVVGCSGSMPGPSAPASAYLLEHDGFRLLIDCGSGASGVLQNYLKFGDLHAVIISHLHADHCLDLVPLSTGRRYHPNAPFPTLPVYGPDGLQQRVCNAFDRWPADSLEDVFAFGLIAMGAYEIGPFRVDTALMAHPVETYGMRFTAGERSITYSSDTGPCDALVELAQDTDLLLCEATNVDGEEAPGLHLTARQAGEHAGRARARRLILTHLPPWADPMRALSQASGGYSGTIECAKPGQVVQF